MPLAKAMTKLATSGTAPTAPMSCTACRASNTPLPAMMMTARRKLNSAGRSGGVQLPPRGHHHRGQRRVRSPARGARHRCGRGRAARRKLRHRLRQRHLGDPVSRRDAETRAVLRVRALLLRHRTVHARLGAVARLTLDDIPAAALARRWGVPQCGLFRTLSSSLDAIHDLGAQGAPSGTVVLAEEQTAGRGRDGRTWRSPFGGVWLGMLLRSPVPPAGVLSLRVGLVVADVVEATLGGGMRSPSLSGPRAALKWPNDVLADDRKVAGILW